MKNSLVLGINFYDYIKNNAFADTQRLLLSMHDRNTDFPVDLAVTQIECRRKASRKLRAFIQSDRFLFPSLLAAEQATHQCVAAYHARIAGKNKRILDMTAGMGIDAFAISCAGNEVTAIELDPQRAEFLLHNSELVGNGSVEVVEGDSLLWISENCPPSHFDVLFVDPARRDSAKRRTYFFKDCLPDIVSSFDIISGAADKIMIKASPIVDISQAVREIPGVTSIHIVCVKGECKEVLLVSEPSAAPDSGDIDIIAVDLIETDDVTAKEKSIFRCKISSLGGNAPVAELSDLRNGTFLYDPNAAIHKLNCGENLCKTFGGLMKMAANTDLYWSDKLFDDFPGRIFRIDSIPDKAELKRMAGSPYETVTRNYTMTPEQLRKKLKVRSGMSDFIFGCKVGRNSRPVLIQCHRIDNTVSNGFAV